MIRSAFHAARHSARHSDLYSARHSSAVLLAGILLVSGCSLAPKHQRPVAPVPAATPTGDAYAGGPVTGDEGLYDSIPLVRYHDVIQDERLDWIVRLGLVESRDLRTALSNVEIARAQYGIARWQRLPSVSAGVGATIGESANSSVNAGDPIETYSADVSLNAFELDLFGRLKNLSDAGFNEFLASRAGAHAARLALVSEISTLYLTIAADRSLLAIARDAVENSRRILSVIDARHKAGVASLLEVKQSETLLYQAKAEIPNIETRLAQSINALNLAVGRSVDTVALPHSLNELTDKFTNPVSGRISSEVLLRRPDVLRAEFQLRAANARIGAARAALFPRLSVTGILGVVSGSFGSLFQSDNVAYSTSPSLRATLFDGSLRSGIRLTNAQKDLLISQYERAIQVAFRETADALARQGTIEAAIAASQARVDAAEYAYRLSMARLEGGVEGLLTTLDAQRQLYAAQQSFIATELSRIANIVALYRVLGGDTELRTPPLARSE